MVARVRRLELPDRARAYTLSGGSPTEYLEYGNFGPLYRCDRTVGGEGEEGGRVGVETPVDFIKSGESNVFFGNPQGLCERRIGSNT